MGINEFTNNIVIKLLKNKIDIQDFLIFGYYNPNILKKVIYSLYRKGHHKLIDKILVEHSRNFLEYMFLK